MKPIARACLLLLCCLPPSARGAPQEATDQGPWFETRLQNGLRVILVDAPLATEQIHFSLLPWGLLDDGPGEAQRVHLVEHLLLAAVAPDPSSSALDGIVLQSETMALTLRLDAYCPLERWRAGLAFHRDWLSGKSLNEEGVEALLPGVREGLAAEQEQAVRSSFTHKWALAAWNQVVRQGARHVSLTGDVAALDVAALIGAASARVRPNREALFVSVGPVPREELLQAVRDELGNLPSVPRPLPAAGLDGAAVLAPGPREASWDLPVGHYLEWYPMPDQGPLDRAAGDALAAIVNHRLQQRGGLAAAGVQAMASADLITQEGRWLLLSASLPTGIDEHKVAAELHAVLAGLDELPEAGLVLREMTRELGEWPDFASLRMELAGQGQVRWIEAMQTLFLVYAQINMGLESRELPRVYAQLDKSRLEALAAAWLVPAHRSSLLLRPE